MEYNQLIELLESLARPEALTGMARYGITPERSYGISIPVLRGLARGCERDHELAGRLWASGSREARILASLIDDPRMVTDRQMEHWAGDFDYWEICDQVCMNLFQNTPLAWKKAGEWASRDEEYYRRAGFVLMARLAVADKNTADERFEGFFSLIKDGAGDDRSMVKKAVSWALRQIGKRNLRLNAGAMKVAREIGKMDSRAARWVSADVLRELGSEKVRQRLTKRVQA